MSHCIFQPRTTANIGEVISVFGPEAHHAVRVKRLEIGEPVRVLDGAGGVAQCVVERTNKSRQGEWELYMRVREVVRTPRIVPEVHVLSAVPKGDALEQMIDGLSQVGAASWGVLASERSVVDPREAKIARLQRVCEESLKQCARAWMLDVRASETFASAIARGGDVVLADASGEQYERRSEHITLLVGPEGGFSASETAAARANGVRVCRFGVHVMRIEVAAVVACASMISAYNRA